MAKLYAMNLIPYMDGRWRDLLPGLPQERVDRALNCRSEADRARSAAAGWLLRYALEQAGIPTEDQQFEKTELGKPYLKGRSDVHFSLSHSGTWAVCALADHPVGVDVELPRCTMEIARRFFHPAELTGLEALPEPERQDRLHRIWTAKEAFTKALGGGLTVPFDSFCVLLTPNRAVLEQNHIKTPYVLHEYRLDSHRICLSTTDAKPNVQIICALFCG